MTEKIFEVFPHADIYIPPKFKDIHELFIFFKHEK